MNSPLSTRNLRYFLILTILVSVLVLGWIAQAGPAHGLLRSLSAENGYERSSLWLWPAIDGDDFRSEDGIAQVNFVRFEGYIWQGTATESRWQLRHNGRIRIWVDGNLVFEDSEVHELQTTELSIHSDSAWLELKIEDYEDINSNRRIYGYPTEMGIYEQGIGGHWQLIPSYRLYPSPVTAELAQNAVLLSQVKLVLLLIIGLALSALLILWLWEKRWWRSSSAWILLAIMLLSIGLRFIVMAQRAAADPYFGFIVPAGDDNYVLMGQELLAGQYELAGTFWPSAPIVWFGAVVALVGPQLWKIYVANILLSGLATGAVTAGAWLAFDKKRLGILSGLIFALYPPLIFYQATPQSVVLDAALAAFALLAAMLAIKGKSLKWAACFGLFIGLGALSRGTALLLGPAFFVALMLDGRAKALQLSAVAALFCLLTLAPQLFLNTLATGEFSPVPYANGALTLYSGNNRDANGIWAERGMAWEIERLQGGDWNAALLRDLRADPLRMLELNLRKLAMFWNRFEYVSNVNYYQQGLNRSELLNSLALAGLINMESLSFLTWIGMVLLLLERRSPSWFIVWSILALLAGTVLFVIAGRLRVPLMPFMSIAAGFGLNALWEMLRQRRINKALLGALGIAIGLTLLFPLMDAQLPRKSYLSELPATALERNDNFNNEIRLIGFDPIESNYLPEGYFYISLYWEVLASPQADYRVFVELADESARLVGYDEQLGIVSYPPRGASSLPIGSIIQEGYLIRLPQNLPEVVRVNVGFYHEGQRLSLVDGAGNLLEQNSVTLFNMGIDNHAEPDSIAASAQSANYQLGENLYLRRYLVNQADDVLDIQILWEADAQIYEDFVIFTHLLDSSGTVVAQLDSPFIQDNRGTAALIPQHPYLMQVQLPLPDDLPAGNYTLRLGAYRFPSIERLTLRDEAGNLMPDNVLLLSEIEFKP